MPSLGESELSLAAAQRRHDHLMRLYVERMASGAASSEADERQLRSAQACMESATIAVEASRAEAATCASCAAEENGSSLASSIDRAVGAAVTASVTQARLDHSVALVSPNRGEDLALLRAEAESRRLRQDLAGCQAMVDMLKGELDKARAQAEQAIQSEVDLRRKAEERASVLVAKSTATIHAMSIEAESHGVTTRQYHEAVDAYTSSQLRADSDKTQLLARQEELRRHLDASRRAEVESNAVIDELRAQLSLLERRLSAAETAGAEKEAAILGQMRLQEQLRQSEELVQVTRNEAAQVAEEALRLGETVSERSGRADRLQNELEETRAQLLGMQREVESLRRNAALSEERCSTNQERARAATVEATELRSKLAAAEHERFQAEARANKLALEVAHANESVLKPLLEEREACVQEALRAAALMHAENRRLASELLDKESAWAEECLASARSVADAEGRAAAAQGALSAEQQKAARNKEEAEAQRERSQAAINSARGEAERLRAKLSSAEKEAAQDRSRCLNAEALRGGAEAAIAQERATATSKVEEMAGKLKLAEENSFALEKEMVRLRKKLADAILANAAAG
mmetsp:Transcript_12320/g.40454  ORF Transcript_12320/g.40454 Transcript_12320/m.40454 type:complete len:584 (+) Transcript_12320:3-1754(+)